MSCSCAWQVLWRIALILRWARPPRKYISPSDTRRTPKCRREKLSTGLGPSSHTHHHEFALDNCFEGFAGQCGTDVAHAKALERRPPQRIPTPETLEPLSQNGYGPFIRPILLGTLPEKIARMAMCMRGGPPLGRKRVESWQKGFKKIQWWALFL